MLEINPERLQPVLDRFKNGGRTQLLPILHSTQETFGYIPGFAAEAIAASLVVPLADVYGVISFYSYFRLVPPEKARIRVCADPACAIRSLRERQNNLRHDQADSGNGEVEEVACLGLCDLSPAVIGEGEYDRLLKDFGWESKQVNISRANRTHIGGDLSVLIRNCGKGKTIWLDDYLSGGGYSGLRKALSMAPADVIAEVKSSGLVGRGGAAFPTGTKWEGVTTAGGATRYLVVNADEAEPGTFKDRVLMEDDPHMLLEGLLIAAYAIGATRGFIYIRAEYPEPYKILLRAIAELMEKGMLGEHILGSRFPFDLEIRRGAGAYVCGEETALFESIEGKRGMPRIKPPFPVTHGLYGRPTAINNVETLCNIPRIILEGAAAYRQHGTEKSAGTKLFCLSGDIARPGLYEVPFGVSLRHLIFDLAGGVRDGKNLKAALLGGASGGFASPAELDVPLTFEDMRSAGIPLGSGVVMVFDESRDLRRVLLRIAHFFADESCGKCYPCQLGTQRQLEILQRLAQGSALDGDTGRLVDLGQTMTDASICGLGQTASSAVLSALRRWPDLAGQQPGGAV